VNVLILGGTTFVGRHIVQACLEADHRVTIFTRGKTNPQLFPEVSRLIGDRDTDLRSIEEAVRARAAAGKSFDACVDVSGYTLAQVERSLDAVSDHVGRYLFISSTLEDAINQG
jgi:2'-hydroxyisoflavone reductase